MNALIVVQARTGSTRLPGKALRPLGGLPMLEFLLRRLRAGKLQAPCCLATTTRRDDDVLASMAERLGNPVVRGACDDVLTRYLQCMDVFRGHALVRVTADNPFTSLEMLRLTIRHLSDGHDYIAVPAGCPHGAGVDAFQAETMLRLARYATDPAEREHINLHILRHPEQFSIFSPAIPKSWQHPNLSLTVDTADDYTRTARIVGDSPPEEFLSFDTVLERTVHQPA